MLRNSYCSLCLSISKRTINIYETDLQYVYENLVNFKIRQDECWMCYICHTRLRQCHQLQQLAVQTRGLIDDIFQKKVAIKFGVYRSLLELSISRTKTFSTTPPHLKMESDGETEFYSNNSILLDESLQNTNGTQIISITPNSSDIKQESDVKTEFRSADELEQDEILEGDYGVEEKFTIDTEVPLDRTGQELPDVESDAHQKSKVLKLKMVELSQSVIEKCFRLSSTTRPTTEIYLEDRGEPTWGKNAEIKQEIEDKGIAQDAEKKNPSDCEADNLKNHSGKGQLLIPIESQKAKKYFICDICSKGYAHKARLNSHILTHTSDISFKCDVCLKVFTQKCDLNSHMRIHTDEHPYCCNICSKKFTKTSSLKKHKLIHTGDQPFSCDVCSKKFTTNSNLKKHKLIHTGEKPFSCDTCARKFTQKSQLNTHISLIHSENKGFTCDICSKKFTKISNLKQHKLIHTGEQPFSCDVCSKKFSIKSNLKKHKLIHTGEKPFSCDICLKKFIQKSQLNSHISLNHTNK